MNIKEYKELTPKEKEIVYMALLLVVNIIMLMIRYVIALVFIHPKVISVNVIYMLVSCIAPYGMWIYATSTTYFNFHRRKLRLLILAYVNSVLTVLQIVYEVEYRILRVLIAKIPPNDAMTPPMIRLLMVISPVIFMSLFGYLLYYLGRYIIFTEERVISIKAFKITHHIDTRENKENMFDLAIMRDLETGEVIKVKENDRRTHALNNGASGTGKTSSVYGPAAENDLTHKYLNQMNRQKLIEQMVKAQEAYIGSNFRNPTEWDVVARKGYEKKLADIRKKYEDCGMTVMAPNNSLNDTIIKLAAARGQVVNVLDPAKDYSAYKNVKQIGMNPFILPFDLTEEDRVIYITNIATVFSEVLVAMNEVNAKTEQYFRDINTSVTTYIAMICMLYRNIRHEQTGIEEIQLCINEVQTLAPMISEIERYYGISVHVSGAEKPARGGLMAGIGRKDFEEDEPKETAESRENPYYMIIKNIKVELLGAGYEKMYDQIRGLRTLINKLMLDPRIKRLLTAKENYLDFDGILKNNEITLVNTALELGPQTSTGLGLFFLLNFKIAVLRRPENLRSFHSVLIDESTQYMHQAYEDMVALFRQYNVCCMFAIQSQSQFEKNEFTRYLKGVFEGVGLHIVFGRIGESEMQMYSSLAGVKKLKMVQRTVSKTSLLTENPSYSMSDRTTPTTENNMEGAEMRYRDFQEITVFWVDNGRIMKARPAKVEFVKPEAFEQREIYQPDWKQYVETLDDWDKPAATTDVDMPVSRLVYDQNISQIEEEEEIDEEISIGEILSAALQEVSAVDDDDDIDDDYIAMVNRMNQ